MRLGNYIVENTITESINDKAILKACFMAGNAGAGKSYTISKITDGAISPRIINVDKYVEFLGAKYDTPEHEKAKKLTKGEAYNYINSLLPLFIDSTSTNTNSTIRKMYLLHDIGYDTAMIFVKTSLETSLKRVDTRNKEGGRFVPLDQAEKYYYKAIEVKDFLKSKFEIYMEVNNDDGELDDEMVIKAYNRMSFFFNSPVKNKKGVDVIDTMKEKGWKYLTDGIYNEQKLKQIVGKWYRGIV